MRVWVVVGGVSGAQKEERGREILEREGESKAGTALLLRTQQQQTTNNKPGIGQSDMLACVMMMSAVARRSARRPQSGT